MSVDKTKSSSCRILTEPLKTACSFCRTKTTDELKLGPVYESNGVVVHYFCLLTASSLPQNGEDEEGILGFYLQDIKNELKVTATRTCIHCKRKGASVSCCSQKCKRWFHLTCGRKNNSLHQFFGRFKSFCSSHRPKQRIDRDELRSEEGSNELVCPICYEPVLDDPFDTMWAPCCRKNAWFHRDCVQNLALSAGYFFKCPLCNNEAIFRGAMEKFGIYIPQRDALWEQVPNAYQDLLYQYRRCDAKKCKCPKGRTHNGQSNWELIRCKTCGSQGVHISCGQLKFSDPEWVCRLCRDVLKKELMDRKKYSRSRSSSSSSSASSTSRSTVPITQPADEDSQISSNSDSIDDPSRERLKGPNSTTSPSTRLKPNPTPSSDKKSEVVSRPGFTNPSIRRSKPCPKRFKKDYVEDETEDMSNANKTESSTQLNVNTTSSPLKLCPPNKESKNNIMVLDSDSDEEIEVLEIHRVLERKSLTANDGTKLEVHPVPEKEKVFYDFRDLGDQSSSSGSTGSEVLSPPKLPGESSASSMPTNSPSCSVNPNLFYKPSTSSLEKCDRLTMGTSGSSQSLAKEKNDVVVKGVGCQINETHSPPKTSSVAAEEQAIPLTSSVTAIPLTTLSIRSHPDPVKGVLETVNLRRLSSQPLPSSSSVTSMVRQNENVGLRIENRNAPARRNSIEEITILDEPPRNKPVVIPSTANNLPNFQPHIVNVRSCANVPNSTMTSPVFPVVAQTGPIVNTNVILCTTGLWLPTSESVLTAPTLNPPPSTMTQLVRNPTTTFGPTESNCNIRISNVRHSNESKFADEYSNGRRSGWSDSDKSSSINQRELAYSTEIAKQSSSSATAKTRTHNHGNNITSSTYICDTRSSVSSNDDKATGRGAEKRDVKSRYHRIDLKKSAHSTTSPSSDSRAKIGSGCYSSGLKANSKSEEAAALPPEVSKENILENQKDTGVKPGRKSTSIPRINRPCPKRFKPANLPESSSSIVRTSISKSSVTERTYGGEKPPKRSCKLCPKCLMPRRPR